MNHLIAAIFGFMVLLAPPVRACVWYGTDLQGNKFSVHGLIGDRLVAELKAYEPRKEWERRRKQHEKTLAKTADRRTRNHYAVTLMHLGRAREAIDILTALEREAPGSYVTAANLGTAYELAGNDTEALRWIRTSIRRNRAAHQGTEWLHVRILEAKIAQRRDPAWLKTHSILGMSFGDEVLPRVVAAYPPGNDGKPVTLDQLKLALWYQLDERYQFVRAPDAVVGSLLFDWANLLVRTDALESAAALYREAIRFGAPRAELAKARLARVEQLLQRAEKREKR